MHRLFRNGVALAALLVSSAVFAQAPKPDSRSSSTDARPKVQDPADDLFAQGAAAYHAGRLAEAEDKLRQAWALKKTHDIAGDLGLVELKLGKLALAAEHIAWALQHFPPTESDQTRQGFADMLANVRLQVVSLRIHVNVDGATVLVNGRSLGTAPPIADEVFVEPGTIRVTARHDAYEAAEQTLSLAKGDARDVSLKLAPIVVEPARRSIVPAAVMGGVGGAALVTGVVLLGLGVSKRSDFFSLGAQTNHTCVVHAPAPQGACAQLASEATQADTLGNGGIVALVVTGAAAIGVTTYMLWPTSRREAGSGRSLRVAPLASVNGGGVLLSGSF
jgi:PEGA domain